MPAGGASCVRPHWGTGGRPGLIRGIAIIAAVAAAILSAATPVRAEDPAYLRAGVGEFDIFHNNKAGDFDLEFQTDRIWYIRPVFGFEFTTDSATYFYGGFNFDLPVGKHIVIELGSAVGHYSNGDGKDLGNAIEFRSGGEVALRLRNQARVGLALHHISNAHLGNHNPGTEILGLTYSIPMGHLFSHDARK